jgi:hypothetical protein
MTCTSFPRGNPKTSDSDLLPIKPQVSTQPSVYWVPLHSSSLHIYFVTCPIYNDFSTCPQPPFAGLLLQHTLFHADGSTTFYQLHQQQLVAQLGRVVSYIPIFPAPRERKIHNEHSGDKPTSVPQRLTQSDFQFTIPGTTPVTKWQ